MRVKRGVVSHAKHKKIFQEIDRICHVYLLPNTYDVVLFGSWAKGNALPTSDFDIGIVGTHKVPHDVMVNIRSVVEEIPTLRSVDVVDLQTVDDHFKKRALAHAKPLHTFYD